MGMKFNPLTGNFDIAGSGEAGPTGADGVGVPTAGTTGQVLNKASNTNYDTAWHTLVKGDVGLGSVDNTSDASKPVSTAQQTALDLKFDKTGGAVTGNLTVRDDASPTKAYKFFTSGSDLDVAGGGANLYISMFDDAAHTTDQKFYLGFNTADHYADAFGNWIFHNDIFGAAYFSVRPDSSEVVVNDDAGDVDFRVEGDTDTDLIHADASSDRVGIGIAVPTVKLDVVGAIKASSTITGSNLSGTNTGDQTLPVGGTPALTLGTANTAGASPNFLRRDDTILVFDATAPSTQAFGDAAAVGVATVAARRDHKHAMPAAPTLAGLGGVPTTTTVNGKALSGNITLGLASADYANQGTTATILHGNAAGNPSFGAVVTADITDDNVTYAKIQNVSATSRFLGRITAAAGDIEELTAANAKTILALVKGDVGLGNVDNTADTAKPVSTAQQTALDLKANLASPTFTGTVTVPDASFANAKLANMATKTYKGRTSALTGVPEDVAVATLKTDLAIAQADVSGLTTASSPTFAGLTINAGSIVTDTTTGLKIGTGTTQKLGFYNSTPVVKPSAYTQTYSTADKTLATQTSAAITNNTGGVVSTTFAAITAGASYAQADATATKNALASTADQVNKLRNDVLDLAQFVNSLTDDLQALGLIA
jgi:hypothetical protein